MKILHTPDTCFVDLPDYPFKPNYVEVGSGLRMHYVDEGSPQGPVVLLLHGEPSWSFLYRKMIPVFVQAGFRVLAPDLIGFGKSSKPAAQEDYTYALHIQWCQKWLEAMGVQHIHLFVQDWGGLIGLRLVAANPELFSSVTAGNTGLPTGDHKMPDAFMQWQAYSRTVDQLPIAKIIENSTVSKLDKEVIKAYEAPFPSAEYQAGAKIFPSLVPTTADNAESQNNRDAWKVLSNMEIPFLTLFSDSDPVTAGGEKVFQKLIAGARHKDHQIIQGGGHFLQEDKGKEIAEIMIQFIQSRT